jgi:hypothetical protein
LTNKPDAIISLADFDESCNMLIYGDSGIGKTVFAGQCGLILGVEKGTISAKRQGSKADLWPISSWTDVQKAYIWLKKNPTAYSWVAMDSVTEMQQKALRWILDKEFKDAGEGSSRDIDIPQIQDHQKWQNMFKRFIKSFCDLPTNVLFTALPLRVEDEEGEELVLPDLQGKGYQISQWVCAQMSIVAHMKKVRKKAGQDAQGEQKYEIVRRFRFQYSPPYFAKDRYDALGVYLDDPTLAEIDARIKEEPEEPKPSRKRSTAKSGGSKRPSPAREVEAPIHAQTEGQDPAENPAEADDDVEDITLDEDEE